MPAASTIRSSPPGRRSAADRWISPGWTPSITEENLEGYGLLEIATTRLRPALLPRRRLPQVSRPPPAAREGEPARLPAHGPAKPVTSCRLSAGTKRWAERVVATDSNSAHPPGRQPAYSSKVITGTRQQLGPTSRRQPFPWTDDKPRRRPRSSPRGPGEALGPGMPPSGFGTVTIRAARRHRAGARALRSLRGLHAPAPGS